MRYTDNELRLLLNIYRSGNRRIKPDSTLAGAPILLLHCHGLVEVEDTGLYRLSSQGEELAAFMTGEYQLADAGGGR